MSVELWLGIGHYLLGVLVIFALVVALMETSRKFDRFHDNSYLLLATGYFLLVVWALIRAMAIGPGILQMAAIICLIAGLLCLAFGYYFHHQAHPNESEDDVKPTTPAKNSPKVHLKEDWMKMLSANEEAPEPEEDPDVESMIKETVEPEPEPEPEEPEQAEASEPVENETTSEPAKPKPVKPAPVKKPSEKPAEEEVQEVDLSHLSRRTKKTKAPEPKPEPVPEPAPVEVPEPAEEPAKESAPVVSQKPGKKVVAKAKQPKQPKEVKETREEIMDDLFPLAHQAKKKKAAGQSDTDILPGEGLHDVK